MTALRFQTRGRHQTSPASLRGRQDREFQALSTDVGSDNSAETPTWCTDLREHLSLSHSRANINLAPAVSESSLKGNDSGPSDNTGDRLSSVSRLRVWTG